MLLGLPMVRAQVEMPSLVIMSADGKDTMFVAQHVAVTYSPDSLHASIVHNDHYRLIFSLPFHGLRTDHLEAVWNVEGKSVYFHSNDTHDRFYSDQLDEMEFASSDAVLDLEKKTLLVKRVPGIYSGNALIVPPSHEVTLAGKQMPIFDEAQVILNSFTRYHHFNAKQVQVRSRRDFEVKGGQTYLFQHPITGKQTSFENVSAKTTAEVHNEHGHQDLVFVTEITITIEEKDNFELFAGKPFKGTATAIDSDPNFFFKGMIGTKKGNTIEWKPFEGKVGDTVKF